MPISAILIPVHLNLKFSLQANLAWVWASHQGFPLARAIPGSSTPASLPLSAPMYPLSASTTGHWRGGQHSNEPGTAAPTGRISLIIFFSSFGAGWCQKFVPQHYISSCIMKISDVLPLTWLKAGLFQKPKQRNLRVFPLIPACAALIHFLQTFCQ